MRKDILIGVCETVDVVNLRRNLGILFLELIKVASYYK